MKSDNTVGDAAAAHLKLVAQRLAEMAPRTASREADATRGPDAQLLCGPLLLTVGGRHGARIERARPWASRGPTALPPLQLSGAPPAFDARPETTAAVWKAIAGGARIIRLKGAPGAGATAVLALLAAGAPHNGFPHGAVLVAGASGSAGDIAARLAAMREPQAPPQHALDDDVDRARSGTRALMLLDRAVLTAPGEHELAARFADSCLVIAGPSDGTTHVPEAILGPLHPQSIVALLEASSGRPIAADHRRVALAMCSECSSSPGRIRLIGVAMRVLACSIISLYVHFETAAGVVDALVASLTPAERSILEVLALARAPLAGHHIAYVLRRSDIGSALDKLTGYELIRAGHDMYELPRYVESFVPPAGDADGIRARIVDAFCDICDSATTIPVLDQQLHAAETLLTNARPDEARPPVLALGPRLAAVYAARAEFGAWGRVLTLVEAAARTAGDTTLLATARHDLGVRDLLLGSSAAAAAHLSSAAHVRRAAGDGLGAGQSAALAAIAEAVSTVPAQASKAGLVVPAADERPRNPVDDSPRRSPIAPRAWAGALVAAVLVMVFAIVLRRAADVPPPSVHFSAHPVSITSGATADLCVDATAAAVIEIFPQAGRLPGTGRHCVAVKPATTTTYVAVGTSSDGRQVHDTVTVAVRGANVRPQIVAFSATPGHITAGQSTRLCYAVIGADLLRIVPRVGDLTRLRACQTLVLREPHRYRYLLSATGDDGQIAMQELHVDVAPRTAPAVPAVVNRARSAQLSQAAIYQFDATPSVVFSGQAASLCVGIERPAHGYVTHLGTLPPGITRCYRVEPRRTTVYRLYVALGSATTVQSVTVIVRPASRRRTVAFHSN